MSHIKVIGIGSPYGNDQLGWQVIEQLRQIMTHQYTHPGHPALVPELIQTDRPGMQLLELMKNVELAILVDAIDNKDCSGQILQLDKSELLTQDHPISSHAIGVSDALTLGNTLGILPANIVLIGLCIDSDDSRVIEHREIMQLCKEINDFLQQTFTATSDQAAIS